MWVILAWRCGVGTKAASAPDRSAPFFEPTIVQTIHLEIAPADLNRLKAALPKRITVPATFRWNDVTVGPVGIRYKGNSSSPPDWPFKRSYLVSFAEYQSGSRFLGLRHVALDNGIQFGGLFSERLITDILRAEGVKASRCNYARVYVNGVADGVFVNVERIDASFVERAFGSGQGLLFKVDEGGPGVDLVYLGENPAQYRQAFECHAGSEATAYPALRDFLKMVNDPAAATATLGEHLDLDAFLKTTAVLLLAGAFDQYTGWNPHNYYLYQNPTDRRWTYIPWDLDVGFADNAFGRIPVLSGWHAAWPAPAPARPLMERIVSDPVLLARYRAEAGRIMETWFRPEVVVPKLHSLRAQIAPALAEDPHPLRRATVPTDRTLDDAVNSMERFMRDRYLLARAQLANPGTRPVPRPIPPEQEHQGPTPGPPSADAPTELVVVKASAAGVELRWVDHAEGEVAYVVQRCGGRDCVDFVNAIGQPGTNVTTATDPQVQPGMTYRYRVYAVLPTPHGPRGTGLSNEVTVTIPSGSPANP